LPRGGAAAASTGQIRTPPIVDPNGLPVLLVLTAGEAARALSMNAAQSGNETETFRLMD
jgi:hypothetical protein